MHTKISVGIPKEITCSIKGRKDSIRVNIKETGWSLWIGFICLRIGTSGRLS
jgi:hypothetical protein